MFLKNYRGKRVLVTGHTGFKGSWLSLWLLELGAKVAGFSKYLPSKPCAFEAMELGQRLQDFKGDVRNFDEVEAIFKEFKPQIVFHLAAQPIVRESYNEPKLTFDTNLGGTINVLECVRDSSIVESAVFITSDKCYDNVNWEWGYREVDRLGGEDPYSASKACAELAFHAYFKSFFNNSQKTGIATARAGNVIGGGDWAADRIVPDCVRAWNKKETPVIRKPEATRPWQHVLEPISGYLWLGALLNRENSGIKGEAFNFGPDPDVVKSVGELVEAMISYSGKGDWKHEPASDDKKEATLLKLNCDKSLNRLNWKPLLSFAETVEMTSNWYQQYYAKHSDLYEFSQSQIQFYIEKGFEKKLPWVVGES
ncbi:MAG: CDP-glucose 4,6-dehydratase [Candidatus Omnitrophota bacterium]